KKALIAQDGSGILNEHFEQRKEKTNIRVHDRAEGMSLQEMREKLAEVGTKRSEKGDPGFMSRGLKDCTALGNVTVESNKNDRYYKCQLTTKCQFIALDERKESPEIRKELSIPRGNGTVVSLELTSDQRMPRFDSLERDLPWHYALRDIFSPTSATEVHHRRELHREERPHQLTRPDPE